MRRESQLIPFPLNSPGCHLQYTLCYWKPNFQRQIHSSQAVYRKYDKSVTKTPILAVEFGQKLRDNKNNPIAEKLEYYTEYQLVRRINYVKSKKIITL